MKRELRPESFGKNLGHLLRELEVSQSDLSDATGLTRAAISQIINGKREPTLRTICEILSVIPVKFERLVSR